MRERDAWIALASTKNVGDLTFGRLLDAHGSAVAALEASASLAPRHADRRLADGIGLRLRPGLARAIRAAADDPLRVERECTALGGWILTPLDQAYPERLIAIAEPPPVLYGLGSAETFSAAHPVAVVGTRRPTAAGRDLAGRIGQRLAEAGATVVSGLAVGIDGACHAAALEAGAMSVAVIGSGIDQPGPASHRRLSQRLVEHGAVIGELAPGVRATQGTFPRRNRIISGLSDATIVVEAPARSGALITARHALEQGRQLLVAPGRPLDPRTRGCLALLRETPAQPLAGLDEMIADLGLDSGADGAMAKGRATAPLSLQGALSLLEPTQQAVARVLSAGPQSVDVIGRATGLDAGVVAASLTMLELRGWARLHGATHLPAGPLLQMDGDGGT